jgi:hypothetical protein
MQRALSVTPIPHAPISNSAIDPAEQPIFVLGTGRSGTTLFRLMLNAHPNIYITHEAAFYNYSIGPSQKLDAPSWLERYFKSFPYAYLPVDADTIRSELVRDRPGLASAFVAIMRAVAKRYGKTRFGDKTPWHSFQVARIFEDFPKAKVIHVLRDPRGAVASLVRMPWASGSHWANALFYRQESELIAPYRDRIHEVRLEDIQQDPERAMRGVLDYVGEPWHPAVLDHDAHAQNDGIPPLPWFSKAQGKLRPAGNEPEWLKLLSPAWIRNIERITQNEMARHGYARAELQHEPSLVAQYAAIARELPQFLSSMRRFNLVVQATGRVDLADPQDVFNLFLNVTPAAWRNYPEWTIPSVPRIKRL